MVAKEEKKDKTRQVTNYIQRGEDRQKEIQLENTVGNTYKSAIIYYLWLQYVLIENMEYSLKII